PSGLPVSPKKPHQDGKGAPRLALPNVKLVREPEWGTYKPPFDADTAFRVVQGEEDGAFDFFVNLDCRHLIGYLRATKDDEKDLIVYWFKWGLTLCCLGMLHGFGLIGKPNGSANTGDPKEADYDPVDVIN